jgi:hypothetical protein
MNGPQEYAGMNCPKAREKMIVKSHFIAHVLIQI